jgi:hypothetical protein
MWTFSAYVWDGLHVRPSGTPFSQELKIEAYVRGFMCGEVPIDCRARAGKAKLHTVTDGLENIAQLVMGRISVWCLLARRARSNGAGIGRSGSVAPRAVLAGPSEGNVAYVWDEHMHELPSHQATIVRGWAASTLARYWRSRLSPHASPFPEAHRRLAPTIHGYARAGGRGRAWAIINSRWAYKPEQQIRCRTEGAVEPKPNRCRPRRGQSLVEPKPLALTQDCRVMTASQSSRVRPHPVVLRVLTATAATAGHPPTQDFARRTPVTPPAARKNAANRRRCCAHREASPGYFHGQMALLSSLVSSPSSAASLLKPISARLAVRQLYALQ